jgi:hypothetical protein
LNKKFPFTPLSPPPPPSTKDKFVFYCFPKYYLVESGFSRVTYLLPKVRNVFDFVTIGDVRLSLTTLQPDIQKLRSVHQAHGTH